MFSVLSEQLNHRPTAQVYKAESVVCLQFSALNVNHVFAPLVLMDSMFTVIYVVFILKFLFKNWMYFKDLIAFSSKHSWEKPNNREHSLKIELDGRLERHSLY